MKTSQVGKQQRLIFHSNWPEQALSSLLIFIKAALLIYPEMLKLQINKGGLVTDDT